MGKFLTLVLIVTVLLLVGWIAFKILMWMLPFVIVAIIVVIVYYIVKKNKNKW